MDRRETVNHERHERARAGQGNDFSGLLRVFPPFRVFRGHRLFLIAALLLAACTRSMTTPGLPIPFLGLLPTATPEPTYTITGQVMLSETLPVAGAEVTDGAGHTVFSGPDGSFSLAGLPAGTYALSVRKPGMVFNQPEVLVSLPSAQAGLTFTGAWQVFVPQVQRNLSNLLYSADFSGEQGWQGLVGLAPALTQPDLPDVVLEPGALEQGYALQADFRLLQGDDAAYGLVFDWINTSEYSFVTISPQAQTFIVYRYVPGDFQFLGGGPAPSANRVGTNRLLLLRLPSALVVSVNGVQLSGTISLPPITNLRSGVTLLVYDHVPADARIDRFMWWGLP